MVLKHYLYWQQKTISYWQGISEINIHSILEPVANQWSTKDHVNNLVFGPVLENRLARIGNKTVGIHYTTSTHLNIVWSLDSPVNILDK